MCASGAGRARGARRYPRSRFKAWRCFVPRGAEEARPRRRSSVVSTARLHAGTGLCLEGRHPEFSRRDRPPGRCRRRKALSRQGRAPVARDFRGRLSRPATLQRGPQIARSRGKHPLKAFAALIRRGAAVTSRKTVLVLGGSSDIGRAAARAFAKAGYDVGLAGRDIAALEPDAADLRARYAIEVGLHKFDVLDTASFDGFANGLPVLPDVVISIVGLLGVQESAEHDLAHATTIMRTNYEGPSLILGLFAEKFLARGNGTIVGVSSVAGDRGRASNYVYGSAKAGFSAFLSGLRARASRGGVHVVTVKPGFVRTKMTEGMKLIGPLTVEAPVVGDAILNAVEKKTDVVYVSGKWRLVMLIIKTLPEAVFKKLKF